MATHWRVLRTGSPDSEPFDSSTELQLSYLDATGMNSRCCLNMETHVTPTSWCAVISRQPCPGRLCHNATWCCGCKCVRRKRMSKTVAHLRLRISSWLVFKWSSIQASSLTYALSRFLCYHVRQFAKEDADRETRNKLRLVN